MEIIYGAVGRSVEKDNEHSEIVVYSNAIYIYPKNSNKTGRH
jgi:hypothetical protein